MAPKEIADHLLAQPTLTMAAMRPLLDYRHAKQKTGAPVDLEDAVYEAGSECEDARQALLDYLERAAKEACEQRERVRTTGVKFHHRTWFALDGRVTAEALNERGARAYRRFHALVNMWLVYADRIVATDEDRAQAAANRQARDIAVWTAQPVKALRAACTKAGIRGVTEREAMAAALVDVGVEP